MKSSLVLRSTVNAHFVSHIAVCTGVLLLLVCASASAEFKATGITVYKNVISVNGTTYATLRSAFDAAQGAGGARIVIPAGTYNLGSDLFSAVTVPVELDFYGPSEVDITATQTVRTNNIAIRFFGQNPAIGEIGSGSPEAVQTPKLRFKATARLDGPMFRIAGPVLGFDLTNVHFDCNSNASWAVVADRMQASVWLGVISADNCISGGFKFPNNSIGMNQDTAFNRIGILIVTRSPACMEADQNSAATSDFDHNIIDEIGCSLRGSKSTTDEVYLQGADGNVINRIWCQIEGGIGSVKSCVHFSKNAYSNYIGLVDGGIPSAPEVVQDFGNSYPNYISNVALGNWLVAGGNTAGNQVVPKGQIIWSDIGFHGIGQKNSAAPTALSIAPTILIAQPITMDNARITLYMWQAASGVGCSGTTSVTFTLSYTDQTRTAETKKATMTIRGNGRVGLNISQLFIINAMSGTTVRYWTNYKVVAQCRTAPKYAFNVDTIN